MVLCPPNAPHAHASGCRYLLSASPTPTDMAPLTALRAGMRPVRASAAAVASIEAARASMARCSTLRTAGAAFLFVLSLVLGSRPWPVTF